MSTYFTKKKLIDDNNDLYVSNYDKSLGIAELEGIIDAKRKYNKAKQAGDTIGMKAANDRANSIRKSKGSYTGGGDGSEYNPVAKPYEIRIKQTYSSPYSSDKKRALSLISDKAEFSYNPEKDPIFKIYKDLYTSLGDDAYERALAESALRTGGVASTSAVSAAAQARNKYNTMLTAKIPELYEAAYDKYSSEYERLYRQLELLADLDDREYKRYRDSVGDFEADREYYYRKDKDLAERLAKQYEFDSELEYDLQADAYKRERDAADDNKWYAEFESESHRDTLNSAINLAKILYGKTPVSGSVVNMLIEMMK